MFSSAKDFYNLLSVTVNVRINAPAFRQQLALALNITLIIARQQAALAQMTCSFYDAPESISQYSNFNKHPF
jgi:hypothetical protein